VNDDVTAVLAASTKVKLEKELNALKEANKNLESNYKKESTRLQKEYVDSQKENAKLNEIINHATHKKDVDAATIGNQVALKIQDLYIKQQFILQNFNQVEEAYRVLTNIKKFWKQ
jgi:hypothetical protein